MPRIAINDRILQSLKTNKSCEDFWDLALTGFVIRVRSSGKKTFEIVYRSNSGKRGRYKIGKVGLISLAEARSKARTLLCSIEQGSNPAAERRAHRAAETFAELFEDYLNFHAKPKLKARSIADIEYNFRSVILPAFGKRRVADIKRADVIRLIEGIGITRLAPVRSNHIRSMLTGIFNFAVQREIVTASPCVGLPAKFKETSRTRVLSDAEIKIFWSVTESQAPVIRDLFRMLLLLGQRSYETRQMAWAQIKEGIWTIPASVTKAGREQRIPLPKLALEILARNRNNSPVVFPVEGAAIKWIQKASYRIRDEMSRELGGNSLPWTPHDLRRTCATGLERLGIAPAVIAEVLNHSKSVNHGVTGRYTRHDFLQEKKAALMRWSGWLESIIHPCEEDRITCIAAPQ